MKKIILVDDEKNILEAYKRNLAGEFNIITADSGDGAIEIIRKEPRIPVIITDYKMPGMNGVELLKKIKEIAPDTVQIMLTGQAEINAVINLINKGKIFRFLTKPCSPEDLISNINDALRQHELITAERELLGKTLGGSIKILIDLLALAKPQAFNKAKKIRDLSRKIYQHLNTDSSWQMEIAATLSQIGTVTIPDEILKRSYRGVTLSDDEMIMYNNHPLIGADMIKSIPRLEKISEMIRYQLKNFDGTGFPPDNLSGEDIPIGARILRIALDFDNSVNSGKTRDQAFEDLKRRPSFYDITLLKNVSRILLDIPENKENPMVLELTVDEIQEGMILAEDVKASDGTVIAGIDQQLSAPLISTFKNYAKNGQIKEKIQVMLVLD
jgi:response regulator RpfG family c-di-GMP phosphodiesterase